MWTRLVCFSFWYSVLIPFTRRLQQEVKNEKYKFRPDGTEKTVRFEEVIEFDEFGRIFFPEGKNFTLRLIQPRADNKPNSSVTIVEFVWFSHHLYGFV